MMREDQRKIVLQYFAKYGIRDIERDAIEDPTELILFLRSEDFQEGSVTRWEEELKELIPHTKIDIYEKKPTWPSKVL
jgi:hypothetical protein